MFCFEKTDIEGVIVVTPHIHEDDRGVLKKTYEKNIFAENGIDFTAVEELETTSRKGVLRGLHLQTKHSQGKLMRVIRGAMYDVAVDLRPGSPTFGKYFGITLSEENKKMVYIPEGFAHGCLALEEGTTHYYLCSQDYQPGYDTGIRWDDETLGIPWPFDKIDQVIVSEKDRGLGSFLELKKKILA